MSLDYLKDHLSPETVEKYGPKPEPPKPQAAAEAASSTETSPAQVEQEAETGPGGEELAAGKMEDTSADPEPKEGGEENATNDATASS